MTGSRSAIDDVESRTFVLDERIRYVYSEPVTNLRQRLKVVPPFAQGHQRRRRWHLVVDGVASSTTRTFLDPFGNVTIDVTVPRVDESVEFIVDVEADLCGPGVPYDTAVDRRHLRHTALTAPDDAMTELASGIGEDDVATLCARVYGSLVYEWGVTGIRTTASEALAGGRGVCQDYAHIMLTACRIAGIAARYVSGHMRGEGGSHAWVEVFRPDPHRWGIWTAEGWDPTHNRRTDADYLVVATGRDYADTAPLSGSYCGDNATNTLAVNKRLIFG